MKKIENRVARRAKEFAKKEPKKSLPRPSIPLKVRMEKRLLCVAEWILFLPNFVTILIMKLLRLIFLRKRFPWENPIHLAILFISIIAYSYMTVAIPWSIYVGENALTSGWHVVNNFAVFGFTVMYLYAQYRIAMAEEPIRINPWHRPSLWLLIHHQ